MEFSDVGIYFASSDAEIWAKFLQERLKEINIHSILENLSSEDEECDKKHYVQVVLAAPGILEIPIPDKLRLMDSNNSVFVLLGVDEEELKLEFVKQKFKQIFDWLVFKAEETPESVSNLLGFIKSLLEAARRTSELSNYDRLPAPRPSLPELRHANPKESDSIPQLHVATVEQDQTIEVFIICNRKGSDEIQIAFSHLPEEYNTTAEIDDKALYRVLLNDEQILENECNFEAKDGSKTIGTGTIPEFNKVEFDTVSSYMPTKSDLIRDMFGEGNDPAPLLCQLFGISNPDGDETDLDLFDDHLANIYKRWQTENPSECNIFIHDVDVHENWPSLLHYAAELNFQKFGKELLDHPYSIKACYTMNPQKAIPQSIAERNGNTEFYRMIRSFLKVESLKGNIPSDLYDMLPTIRESQGEDQEAIKKQKHSSQLWKNIKSKLKRRKKSLTPGTALEEEGIPKSRQRMRTNSVPTESAFTSERTLSTSSTSSGERVESGYYDSSKNEDPDSIDHLPDNSVKSSPGHLHPSKSFTLPHKTKF